MLQQQREMKASLMSDFSNSDETGNVTVLALILAVVLIVGLGIATEFCKAVLEHHRVKNAVEAAALAGAQDLLVSGGQACSSAREVAQMNHVAMDGCMATGEDIAIQVSSQISLFGRAYIIRENARAGFA